MLMTSISIAVSDIELETLCAILFVCLGWYSHVLHQELNLEEDIETRKTITPLSRTYIAL